MRRYGLEFEFAAPCELNPLAKLLRAWRVQARARDGGNSNGKAWELKPDKSAVPLFLYAQGWRGYELASPVLAGVQGFSALQKYLFRLDHLRSIGKLQVPEQAGLHVHVEVKDYTWTNLARLVKLMIEVEDSIYAILPECRQANGYCRGIKHNPTYRAISLMRGEAQEENIKHLVQRLTENRLEDRYFGLNLTDYTRNRTVEFRYGASTFDYSKAESWINTLLGIVEAGTLSETRALATAREALETAAV